MSPAAQQLHMPIVGEARHTTPHRTPENAATTLYHSTVDLAVAIPLALSRAGLSHKQACAHMDLDASNWAKALQGNGHVSLQRLLLLPVAFWCEFLPMLAEPVGLCVSHDDLADLALKQTAVAIDALVRTVTQLRAQRRTA